MTRDPYDIPSEKDLLGILLLSQDQVEKTLSIIQTEDLSKAHQPILQKIQDRFQSGLDGDLGSVIADLRDSGQLEEAGGPAYVAGLTSGVSSAIDATPILERIRLSADKRAAAAAIKGALKRVSNGNGANPYDTIGALIQELQTIQGAAARNEPREYANLANRVREYIATIDGTFFAYQLFADLGIKESRDKTNVRQILKRLKGQLIQPHGNAAGCYRVIRGEVEKMNLQNSDEEQFDLWLPMDLHNYVQIMPNNEIVVTGDPDSGKTAFLLRTIRQNLEKWDCHYFNSEMGALELRKRLNLFEGFPIEHQHFHPYERSDCFEDVIQPGKYVLNVIDYLEITDEFYLIAKHLADIYKALHGSVALIAIQKRNRNSDLPLGAQRALEKPRLAVALSAGNKTTPNRATILKCKNRKTIHSMIGHSREFKLISGCEFRCESPVWS